MPIFDTDSCVSRTPTPPHRHQLRSAPALVLVGASLFAACIADEPGLSDPVVTGSAGQGGAESQIGAAGSPGSAGQNGAEDAAGSAGSAGLGGSATGGTAGNEPTGGTQPEAGAGGDADEGGVHIGPVCTFHTEIAAAEVGAAGAPSDPPTITVQLSPFVGSYLADVAGRTLYTSGGDLPGDCNTPPQSLCTADCPESWPPFDAGLRVLPEGLSDAGFGTIPRGDGTFQTTYMGWPLYYYKSDLTLGQMTGQGKGKTWQVAEVALPSITIMKAGAIKYLADQAGRTLYVSAADQAGTADADPVSACAGECLDTFEGFRDKNFSIVTALEPLDFSVFVRHGMGGIQVAYKGMPLYRAATDLKSGDMNGTAVTGFTTALP